MGSCWSFPLTCQGQQGVWAKQSPQLREERENPEEGPPHRSSITQDFACLISSPALVFEANSYGK